MALHLLCLVGILLGALGIQAQDSLPTVTSRLSLSNFSLQPDFQYDQFQGKWYFLTLAEFIGVNRNRSDAVIQSINFKLNDDNSYNITIAFYSNFTCKQHQHVSLPMEEPGVFIFHSVKCQERINLGIHIVADDASWKISMKVMATDYNRFATVLFRMVLNNTEVFIVFVLGRNKELSPEVTEHCRSVARSLSLSAEFTFTDLKALTLFLPQKRSALLTDLLMKK